VPWYRASFDPAHRDRRVVRSGSHAVRAGGIHDLRDVALLFACASFGGLFPTHRGDVRRPFRTRTPRCPTRRALRGWTSLYRKRSHHLTSSVACKHHPSAPVREDSSPHAPLPVVRLHLQARTASRTPGEERTLERFRTPSVVYGPDALITRRPFISWRLVKDATKRLRTVSPLLVPPRAFNARSTSLGLDTQDFA